MAKLKITRLLPGLIQVRDTCNVYIIHDEKDAIAIDFGSGAWLPQLKQMGLPAISRVYLTHHHVDQCEGLLKKKNWPFEIHAPVDERGHLEPEMVRRFWQIRNLGPVPSSYSTLKRGIPNVRYDVAGFSDQFWGTRRIRFLLTPGHGRGAISYLVDIDGKQVLFCGDAAHADAKIHQPYHLEWDHWTAKGVQEALNGVQIIMHIGMDLLCPSHGPIIDKQPRRMLAQLEKKLHAFVRAKGSICSGEKDRYIDPTFTKTGAAQLSENLFHVGVNTYLVRSATGKALLVDPLVGSLPAIYNLLDELNIDRVDAATATHYHVDHVDGIPDLRKKFRNMKICLHPRVAAPLANPKAYDAPWRMNIKIKPTDMMPRKGRWQWENFSFRVAPAGGQTWWHFAMMADIDGQRVLFGGDSFQPNSRWNGTGGFCSYNGSRFNEGFERSAKLIMDWSPDIVVCGHKTYVRYSTSQYRKIIKWARTSEQTVRSLCPSSNLEKDYYLHPAKD